MRLILDDDLVIGSGTGDLPGPTCPAELAGVPLARLRWDGAAIIDAATVTEWHVDANAQKRLAAAPDRDLVTCAWDARLIQDGGVWRAWTNEETLAAIKATAKRRVDAAAEAARLEWITPGDGQSMSYQHKAAEATAAQAIVDGGGTPEAADYPLLASEIGTTGATVAAVASAVLAARAAWIAAEAQINQTRLQAKAAIDVGASADEIETIITGLDWPHPED